MFKSQSRHVNPGHYIQNSGVVGLDCKVKFLWCMYPHAEIPARATNSVNYICKDIDPSTSSRDQNSL